MTRYEYIETDDALQHAARELAGEAVLAVDTEFVRTRTYYAVLGLVQVCAGEHCFLIDPLAVRDMAPLKELLTSNDVCKVLHAASEDIEVLTHSLDVFIHPIFDTQIAAAVLGVGYSLGYSALVAHHLDIELPKDETRSDWTRRPLTDSQKEYAALDVIYLQQVYREQQRALADSPRAAWVREECFALGQDIATLTEPDEWYLRLGGLSRFNRRQLNVLRALAAWRETVARRDDMPRNWLMEQKSMLAIARDEITSKRKLETEAGLSRGRIRKHGDELVALIDEALHTPEHDCPPLVPKAAVRPEKEQVARLMKVVQAEAEAHGIPPELLAKRRDLEGLLRSRDAEGEHHLPNALTGWREAVIGEPLLAFLESAS